MELMKQERYQLRKEVMYFGLFESDLSSKATWIVGGSILGIAWIKDNWTFKVIKPLGKDKETLDNGKTLEVG